MFHREKTEGRQKVAALSGVIALVTGLVVTNWDRISPPSGTANPPQVQSLLTGHVESTEDCILSAKGVLTFSLNARTAAQNPSCCITQTSARSVKPGDTFSASVVADRAEADMRMSLITKDKQMIIMRSGSIYGSENVVTAVFDGQRHLGGKDSASLAAFCISLAGPGEAQSIKVVKAAVSSSVEGK